MMLLLELQELRASQNVELLLEKLGNLAVLKAGPLINVFKQTFGSSTRHGSHISYDYKKFQSTHSIHAESIVSEKQPFKDMASFKKFIKNQTGAYATLGFAFYLKDKPNAIILGMVHYNDINRPTGDTAVAYDLSDVNFTEEELKNANQWSDSDRFYFHKKSATTKETSEFERRESKAELKVKTGKLITNSMLARMLVAVQKHHPLEFRTISYNGETNKRRVDRSNNRPGKVLQGSKEVRDQEVKENEPYRAKEELKKRLRAFKLAKFPEVKDIHEFLNAAIVKNVKAVRLDGHTFSVHKSSHETINPVSLLSGERFKVEYKCLDNDYTYQSIRVWYMYDVKTNMVMPFEAELPFGEYGARSVVLDRQAWMRYKKIDPKDKRSTMIAILKYLKNSQWKLAKEMVDVLEQEGHHWPELEAIKKSIAAEKDD